MIDKRIKRFLYGLLFSLLILVTLYVALFKLTLNTYAPSEWWVSDVYQYKKLKANSTQGPKVLITGGSSVLFGINSKVIEEITGYPVVNLGSHVTLTLKYHYKVLGNLVKQGDIVVLPLEYKFYARERPTKMFYNNMFSWGYEPYLSKLTLLEKLTFMVDTPKILLAQRLYYRFKEPGKPLPLKNKKTILDTVAAYPAGGEWRGYKLESLNSAGDILVDSSPNNRTKQRYTLTRQILPRVAVDNFFENYQKIHQLIENRGATLILTWPVNMRTPRHDFLTPQTQNRAKRLKSFLAKKGVRIHCNPTLHNLDLRFFFNSELHTNIQGATINSINLAQCVLQVLNDTEPDELEFANSMETLCRQEKAFGKSIDPVADVERPNYCLQ